MMMPEDNSVYKSIFLHAAYAVIISNAEHYIVECNVAALEMFGFEEHELLGKHKTDIIIIDNELGYQFDDNSFSNKTKPIRAIAFRKNGEQFPISFSSFTFENNLCCFINDLSEEFAQEKQQERTIEILQETNHIARVGGYEVDIASGTAVWTIETKEIHELPAEYEPNLEEAILFYKEGEVRDTIVKVVRDAIEYGIPYSVELPLTTAKGNERWIKTTGNTEFKDGKCVRLYGIVQDIHDAKTLQNDLKKEKTLLRTLIDNLPVAVFVKDVHARKLIANKMDVANMELEREEEALGKTNLEIFNWEENHWGYEQDLKVFTTKKPLIDDVQTTYNRKGEKIIYAVTKIPTFDEGGVLNGLVGVCTNITEKVRLEEKLKLVDFAFANAAISIFLLNADATFYDFNETAHKLLGYTKEELMALKVQDINPEYSVEEWPNHWAELREKKSMVFTSVERKKDGTDIDVEIKANLIKYGDKEINCAFVTDITEKKKAEAELAKSNERYVHALKATSDVIWDVDLRSNSLFLSDVFETCFGHKVAQTESANNNVWISNVHPDDLVGVLEKSNKAIADDKEFWEHEYRLRKADGTYAYVIDNGFVVRDSVGNAIRLVGAIRDISQQKEVEITLQRSNERYEYATKATSDLIWESDLITKEVFFSKNFELIFGYSIEHKQTTDNNVWRRNIHPEDIEKIKQKRILMLKTHEDKWDDEYRFKKANGEYAWILDKTLIIRDDNGKPIKLVGAIRDITTKKQEEERLKLLETVITNSTDAILITGTEMIGDADLPIIYVNKAFSDITGYSTEELTGKTPRILQGPLSDRNELDKMSYSIKNWQPCEIEIINYKKDGSPFWSNISIVPVANEKGWYTHWVSIQKDITIRKETERAFAEMAALQRSVLDSANLAIISTDINGVIKSFNEGAETMLGYKAHEIIDKATPELMHDKDEIVKRAYELTIELGRKIELGFDVFIAKAKLGISTENEWTYIHKNKNRFPVSLSITSLHDAEGRVIGYLGIARDITYEKQIKEELRISYEKLEETVNELKQQQFAIDQHDIVSITDVKGIIIYANDSFCKISKYTKEELIGQNHRLIKSGIHPTSVFVDMYHTIANGKVWKGDLCNKAKDGTLYWVSNTIVPYMDAKTNKPLRYVSIRTDITDKKLAELEREKLLEEVTNNNRELKQFSYITSHNLRAPLTNLLSICNLIKSDTITDPLTKKLIEGFKKSTFDLNDTLNDLISILIIKENINLPIAEVDFEQTLQKVVSSINKSVEKTNTIINADFSAVPSVHFNPTYLESIFLNLITNSIKYSKPGIEPTILITTIKNRDGSIKMIFTDNGIGMDMERVKNKIFGLYQRFHTNADSKGIGLYLIYSQIVALGGKIEFYSEVNIGTTFTLTFK